MTPAINKYFSYSPQSNSSTSAETSSYNFLNYSLTISYLCSVSILSLIDITIFEVIINFTSLSFIVLTLLAYKMDSH